MDYNVRLAVRDDASKLAKVKLAAWETTYRGIYPDNKFDNYDFEFNENKFKSIIEREDIDLYVVVADGDIVGYMSFGVPLRPYDKYEQEIGLLYLLKDYRGYGIGKSLFQLANEMIKVKGYDRFFISCNKYNENARKFYEAMGGILVCIDEDNVDMSLPQVKYHYDVK